MTPKFIYTETYGCSANQNNTEIMKGLVIHSGLELTNNPEIADIILINTCIVKIPTQNKINRRIAELKKLKKPLIIAGCLPEIQNNEKELYYLGTNHVKDIVKLIRKIFDSSYEKEQFLSKEKEIKLNFPKIPAKKKTGITQISEGCLGNCNFCITRFAKGKLFSYPQEEIIKNIKQDISSGCKEIWLTSQDNAAYGLDSGKPFLPKLLTEILEIKGNFLVRLGMMNPNNVLPILPELIEIYKNKKMYKFLHIPIQSGSDKILKLMNRKYKIEDFLKIINKFKQEIPEISISTDIIVGYPGEAEEDYSASFNLISSLSPDSLNVNRFWPIKGTKAEKLEQIPREIIDKRAEKLIELYKKSIQNKNSQLIGTKQKALVTEINKQLFARNSSYKLIELNSSDKNLIGKFIEVEITGIKQNHLLGKIL
ncbi:tRNA (N(6)-L-threonylcarbamoyladenosine(37)-C(2))-methylthiotransferase [Candidatus Pacearchaeota archaeon]|nr:tRNA (N(6)-L-threonylcarbamoyladenosine(37)-C(2))-methylthiotransferase [Candidatus Pacearchaeota archaeon]